MSSHTQPNLLLITTDQQRFDTVAPHAPDFLRTPHLDLLRYEGVRFDRTYAQTPLCVPSRVSLMTGRSPLSHGMMTNGSTSTVMGRNNTVPALLRTAGYATCAIGKMHFTPERARHGFEEMLLPADYYDWIRQTGSLMQPMRHGLGQNELYPSTATVPEAATLTSWIAEQCVSYIRDRRDPTAPFFLWASFSKPHPPLDPPEPYASMYHDEAMPPPRSAAWASDDQCPPALLRQRQRAGSDLIPPPVIAAARAAYYGLITHIDYSIGRILAALQDLDLLATTTIIFTSDHGEFLGDFGMSRKSAFHDPAARVPLLLRPAPSLGLNLHGTTCQALTTHTDVSATLAAAAGAPIPTDWEGHDLHALARGQTPGRHTLLSLATQRHHGHESPTYLGITNGHWKYIWYPEGARQQLFDLTTDPQELVEASAAEPQITGQLRSQLCAQITRYHSPWATDDTLLELPLRGDTERDRRATNWPGLHTEHHPVDVRH